MHERSIDSCDDIEELRSVTKPYYGLGNCRPHSAKTMRLS